MDRSVRTMKLYGFAGNDVRKLQDYAQQAVKVLNSWRFLKLRLELANIGQGPFESKVICRQSTLSLTELSHCSQWKPIVPYHSICKMSDSAEV